MSNVRKRISELTALTSASLDTVVVGVDNGTTYKIELDVLADAVTSRVNILDRNRLSSLESVTSSFETKGRSVISSSAQITALGFTSSSANLNSLNDFTSSQTTLNTTFTNGINGKLATSSFEAFSSSVHSEILAATNEQDLTPYITDIVYEVLSSSVDSRLDRLETNTASYITSLNGAISSSSQLTASYDSRYVLSGSITQTTWDNISGKPSGLVSQSTDLASLNLFTQSIDVRVDSLENATSSYLTSLNGAISSSSQVLDILSSLNAVSHSHSNKTELDVINQNLSTTSNVQFHDLILEGTGSFQSDLTVYGNLKVWGTQSIINSTNVELSDNIIYLSPTASGDYDLGIVGHYNNGTYQHTGIFSDASDGHAWKVFKGLQSETTGAYVDTNGVGFTLADFKANNIYGAIYATNGVISGSSQLTSSYDSRYVLSGSITQTTWDNISGKPAGLVSQSTELTSLNSFTQSVNSRISSLENATSSYETIGRGIISSSAQLPSGLISGSSQLTASYDTRYTLSGSVSAVPAGTISGSAQITAFGFVSSSTSVPAGTISGSSQLTSSFDGRYVQTGSFNTLTASFNSFTASAQAVTTGSNSFNGTQTITGSLIITTGSFIGSQILANTSSLYLTSGSNLYLQNSGIAEITGSLLLSGSMSIQSGSITMPNRAAFRVIGNSSADRTTPSTLSGSAVTIDYNEGGHFNATNGLFTAPVAGLYNVYYNGRCGSANSAMQVIIYKNGTAVQLMWEAAGNTGATHFGVSGIVKLAVNDTLRATVTVGSIQFDGNDSFGATYIG